MSVHEQKIIQQDTEEQALKASNFKSSDRGKGKWKDKNPYHKSDEDYASDTRKGNNYRQFRGNKTNNDKSKVECFRCHRYGHYKSECRTKLHHDRGQKSNYVEEKEEDISLLMACHKEEKMHGSMWYLDTGCNNHMCGDKSLFSDMDESFQSTIKFGDNSTVSIIGKGNVKIYTKDNTKHCIGNVYFPPDLKTNLLSVGQLQEKGFEINIKDGVCCIQNKEKGLVAEINMTSNRMFPLHFRNTSQISLSAELKDESWL